MNTHLSIHPSSTKPGEFWIEVNDDEPQTIMFVYQDDDYAGRSEITLFAHNLSAEALQSAASSLAAASDKLFEMARGRTGLVTYMGWSVHPTHHFVPEHDDDNVECTFCGVRPYNDDARLACKGM
jgi:hypothetical protein